MLGQIKATVNKKVNQVGSASSQAPPPPSTPKNHRRKKGRHGNRRGEKGEKGVEPNSDKLGNRLKKDGINKRKEKEDTSSHTEDDGASSRRNKKKSMVGWIGGSVDKVVNLFDKEKRVRVSKSVNPPDSWENVAHPLASIMNRNPDKI